MAFFGITTKQKTAEPQIDVALVAATRDRLAARLSTVDKSRQRDLCAMRGSGREHRRTSVYRVASAAFAPEHEASCKVIDQSFSGLRLAFHGETQCPDEFALTIPTLRFIGIVRKIWESGDEVGVSILRWSDAASRPEHLTGVFQTISVEL